MRRKERRLSSLFLTTLMVLSVFTGTVAFSGSTAAQTSATDVSITSAVEAGGNVEVVTDKAVEPTAIEIELDGRTVVDYDGGSDTSGIHGDTGITVSGTAPFSTVDVVGASGEYRHNVRLEDGSDNLVDVDPNRDLDITLTYTTGSGGTETVTDEVTLTSDVVSEGDSNSAQSDAARVYQGDDIAIRSDSTDDEIYIPQTGQDLSTGTNSKLLTVDTGTLSAGADYEINFDGESDADDTEWFTVEDLQWSASAAQTSYALGDTIEVDVSAQRGGSPLTAEMKNDDGDVVAEISQDLGGGGTSTLPFDSADNSDINATGGPYTVTVTDNATTNAATTDPISVVEPATTGTAIDSAVEADGRVELITEQPVEPEEIEIELDGDTVLDGYSADSDGIHQETFTASGTAPFSQVEVTDGKNANQRHRIRLEDSGGSLVDVDPNRNLEITLTYDSSETATTEVTLTSAVVSEGDGNAERYGGPSVYRGADIAVRADDAGNEVYVENNDTSDIAIGGTTGANSRLLTIDTSEQEPAEYEINFDGESDADDTEWFSLWDLELSASADEESYAVNEPVTVDVSATRGGEPLTAEMKNDDGDRVARLSRDLGGGGTSTLSFDPETNDDIDPDDGPYTVTVTDNATNATATTDPINVTERATPGVSFNRTTYREERGDVVEIGLSLRDADSATVRLGAASDGWAQNVTVEDMDNDDFVTVEFNTYTAGASDNVYGLGTPFLTYSVADDEDAITSVAISSGVIDAVDTASERTLDATRYPLTVVAGATPAARVDGGANDTSLLSLSERGTTDLTTYAAPAERQRDIDSAGDIDDLVDSGNVTETGELAMGDLLVTEIRASGLQGVLKNQTDDAAPNVSQAFFREAVGYGAGETDSAWSFHVNETDVPANLDPYNATLNAANTQVYPNPAEDTYWLVTETDAVTEFSDGDAIRANFTTREADDINEETVSVLDTATLVERNATVASKVDLDDDGTADEVALRNGSGAQLSGESTLAPGTELSVQVTGTDSTATFFAPLSTRVQSEGSWRVSPSLDGVPAGTNVTVDVRQGGESMLEDIVDGRVVDAPQASVTFEDQTSFGQGVTVASVTLSEGGFVTVRRGDRNGAVLGRSQSLSPGTHQNVAVPLNRTLTANATLVAVPHRERNASSSGPYQAYGSAVTGSADIRVAGAVGTPTERTPATRTSTATDGPTTRTDTTSSPTATAGENDSGNGTTTSGDGAGFGTVVGALALVVAAALAGRR